MVAAVPVLRDKEARNKINAMNQIDIAVQKFRLLTLRSLLWLFFVDIFAYEGFLLEGISLSLLFRLLLLQLFLLAILLHGEDNDDKW